jgi:hypothetical protein
MIIWGALREHILELDVNTAARLENVVLRETLNNQQFMKHLETALKEAFRSGQKG